MSGALTYKYLLNNLPNMFYFINQSSQLTRELTARNLLQFQKCSQRIHGSQFDLLPSWYSAAILKPIVKLAHTMHLNGNKNTTCAQYIITVFMGKCDYLV